MIQRKRWRLSPEEKIDIWRRWKCGQSQHEIGRACGRPHPTIRKLLSPCGGIAPAARRRSRLALTLVEREDISRGIASDWPIREIARLLKRSASTVSRRSLAMAVVLLIVPTMQIAGHGCRRCARSVVF